MRRFPGTPQWTRLPPNLTCEEKVAILQARLNDVLSWIDEVANLPAMKDYLPVAFTAADDGTVNSGDATTDDVIENLRTRMAEHEARWSGFGLEP